MTPRQDTAGPITQSVTAAAIILTATIGQDTRDNYTLAQPPSLPNYTAALDASTLHGKKVGVVWLDNNLLNELFRKLRLGQTDLQLSADRPGNCRGSACES